MYSEKIALLPSGNGCNDLHGLADTSHDRVLMSRLVFTAFQQAADDVELIDRTCVGSTGLWFQPRALGLVKLRVAEGMALKTNAAPACALAIATTTKSIITQFTVQAPERLEPDKKSETERIETEHGWMLVRRRERLREAFPLARTYEDTLMTLGGHTRRNMRHCRKQAMVGRLKYSMMWHGADVDSAARAALGSKTKPYPMLQSRMRRLEAYAAAAGEPFRSSVASETGELISYCCGFINNRTAYLVYQLNSNDWKRLSPSLLHRGYLIESLIQAGCNELIFIHGCSGVLRNSCIPTTVDRYVVVRDTYIGHALTRCITALLPNNRVSRILHGLSNGTSDTHTDQMSDDG